MPPRTKPTILLISLAKETLFQELFADQLNALESWAQVIETTTKKESLAALRKKPLAALCTDAAITKAKNVNFAWQVASYANDGGFVVLCGLFALRAEPGELDELLKTVFQFPWRAGPHEEDLCSFNPNLTNEIVTVDGGRHVVREVRLKALFLKGAREVEKVFLPTTYAQGQTPVCITDLGDGWVSFVGDCEGREELAGCLLAVCGLVAWSLNYSA